MDEKSFAFWLQGFVEITNPEQPTKEQWQIIKDHLALVFNKVTPGYYPNQNPRGGGFVGITNTALLNEDKNTLSNYLGFNCFSGLGSLANVYNESGYPLPGSPAYSLYFDTNGVQKKWDHSFTC